MLSALILSEHSYPALPLTRQLEHQRFVRPGPLVLRSEPLNSPAPTVDKDRTVSRRSEPSSRTTLTGEQPDPWDLLQPQDVMSRHRGAKPCRRYELLGRRSEEHTSELPSRPVSSYAVFCLKKKKHPFRIRQENRWPASARPSSNRNQPPRGQPAGRFFF